jgi:hydroxypyruvate reductase
VRAKPEPRDAARAIIDAALAAVEPAASVRRRLRRAGEELQAGDLRLPLAAIGRIVVVGAGKAGVPMARAVEEALGDRIAAGHVVVPRGQRAELERITVHEAGHPVPDAAGVAAGRAVLEAVGGLDERDLVICVISGGGSALLVCPAEGIALEDLQATNRELLACGASIVEINTLRKHLSALKGGQLARAAAPARVITLVLSDVVGDPLDAIASGPTVPDPTSFADALAIVERYGLAERLPATVVGRLRSGLAGGVEETPKPGDPLFDRVANLLVASNDQAVSAAAAMAAELGYTPCVLSTLIEGETREVARVHAAIAREARLSGRPCTPPCCLISGGETTVTLRGGGRGGRNQEFVLAAALDIAGQQGILVCSIGTDGIDGTTDAAGAWADGETVARSRGAGIDPRSRLDDNDSHAVFSALGDLIVTGPTDTNVMDLRLLLVE